MTTGIKRQKPNYLYSIVGVSIVLFLLGIAGIFYVNGQIFINKIYAQLGFIAEVDDHLTMSQLDTVEMKIASVSGIAKGSIEYITKEASFDQLKRDFGDDFADMEIPNPLYNIFTFQITGAHISNERLNQLESEIRSIPGIKDTFFQTEMGQSLVKKLSDFMVILSILAIVFLILSSVLIHNTVKLALYANRFSIKNMELIGASWSYIRRPFLLKAATNGFLSAFLAILGLFLLLIFTTNQFDISGLTVLISQHWFIFVGILLLGMVICLLSTLFAVNKYLRLPVEQLH